MRTSRRFPARLRKTDVLYGSIEMAVKDLQQGWRLEKMNRSKRLI